MQKRTDGTLIILLLVFIFGLQVSLPSLAHAWTPKDPIIPVATCQGDDKPPCEYDWTELLLLVNNAISFLLYASTLIAAIAFAIAGFKYLTAGGDSGKIKSAHSIFRNVIIGLLLALSAWLIVHAIIVGLVHEGERCKYSLLDKC